MPLLLSIPDQLLHIVWIDRVKNVPKVSTVGQSAFWKLGRKVLHEFFFFLHHWPESFNRKLVIKRYVNSSDLVHLK